jgi:hypothetical protein
VIYRQAQVLSTDYRSADPGKTPNHSRMAYL